MSVEAAKDPLSKLDSSVEHECIPRELVGADKSAEIPDGRFENRYFAVGCTIACRALNRQTTNSEELDWAGKGTCRVARKEGEVDRANMGAGDVVVALHIKKKEGVASEVHTGVNNTPLLATQG
jgi:hypothetical protein